MVRYLFFLSYIGSRYRGAQKNIPNCEILDVDSIQGAVESAFLSFLPKPVWITLSSRTDSGVHALQSAIHCDITRNKSDLKLYQSDFLVRYLNRYLIKADHDIRILSCRPVVSDFHSRHRAIKRSYLYRIAVPKEQDFQCVPIMEHGRTYFLRDETFDAEKVREGTKLFLGPKNFQTFSGQPRNRFGEIKYVRALENFNFEKSSPLFPADPLNQNLDFYCFTVIGKSFLYNQIRRMVGALLALGSGRINEWDIQEMLQVPSHQNWNPKVSLAPPYGLYLKSVEFDPDFLQACTITGEDDERIQVAEQTQESL